jgi:acyl-CoA synthetase (NDP forming)
VDVGATATPAEFAAAVADALASDAVDALIAVFVPPVATPGAEYATALREAVADAGKPVVTTFLAAEGIPDSLAVRDAAGVPARGSVPSYPGPERAALALSRAVRYAAWRERPLPEVVRPEGADAEAARALVDGWLAADPDGRWLTDAETVQLLGSYGVAVTEFRTTHGPAEAAVAAAGLGFPVAVKATGEHWRHRTDFAGVRLDLSSAEAVRGAAAELAAVTGSDEVHVQRMAVKGISCTVGVQDDPSFGSLVSFGLAGVISDLLGDRAYRVLPVTPTDAHDLVRAPRAAPLLAGYRGSEPCDLAALEDLVLRVATLADDVHELREVSCEPVLASATGAAVTGARVRLGPPPSRADLGPRRLR